MTTTTDFLIAIANELTETQPESAFRWCIRGEIPNEEIDENKNLIAVLHLTAQDEVIPRNKTLRLSCSLTGQVLVGEYTVEAIKREIELLELHFNEYLLDAHFKEVEDAILIEANANGVETSTENLYLNFSIPCEIVAQF